jgi:hypothetical protein
MRQPSRFSEAGFESMKMGVFLLFGRTKRPDLHRTARPRFSPLSAGSSVLDALWIVAIILEQPAYALIVPSRPIRFWLLILSLQVLPQNKIKLISSEKKLPQLFDFIWAPRTEVPGLNDIKKLRCHWLLILFCCPHCCSR